MTNQKKRSSRDSTDSANRKRTIEEYSGVPLEDLRRIYHFLKKTRELDTRMKILFRQGQFEGTYFSSIGEEATTVVPTFFLRKDDFIGPSHRELGAFVTRGYPTRMILAQLYARADSEDRGHNHPGHWGWKDGFILAHCPLMASQIPVATGAALSYELRGLDRVAMTFFGEGASSKGAFHESLNFAGVHRLPVVYICQNNFYAESVPIHLQAGNTDVSSRAVGYGITGVRTDGNDVLKVYKVAKEAVDRARHGEGPTLLHLDTYRWYGHSEIDPATYRPAEEVEDWIKNRDPLKNYEKFLLGEGLYTEADIERITREITAEIEDAIEFTENSPEPEAEISLENVYAE